MLTQIHALRKALPFAALGLLFPLATTQAQYTWDITPGTVGVGNGTVEDGAGTWDTSAGNWTQDAGANNVTFIPGETSTATVGAGGAGGTVTVANGGSPILLGELILGPASSAYTIAGDGLDFTTATSVTSNITVARNSIISAPITKLSGNGNLTLRRSGTTTNNDLTISSDNATTLTNQTNIDQEVWLRLNHQNGVGTSGNLRLIGSDARLIVGGTQVSGDPTFTLQKNLFVNSTGTNKTVQLTGGTSNTAILAGSLNLLETVTSHFSVNPNGNGTGVQLGQVLTVTGRITGTGFANGENAMVMTGNGVLRLDPTANDNNFRGRVNLNSANAVLVIAKSGALANPTDGGVAAADATEVRFNEGGQVLLSDGVVTHAANDMTLNNNGGNKLLGLEASATSGIWGGPINNNEANEQQFDLRADLDQTLTVGGMISGGGASGINTIGDGSIVLNGDNTFTGGAHLGDSASSTFNGTSGNKQGFTIIGHDNALGTGKAISRGSQIQAASAGMVITNAIDISGGGLRLGGTNSFELSGQITLIDSDPRDIANYGSTAGVDFTLSGGIDTNGQNLNFRGSVADSNNGGFFVSSAITGDGNVTVQSDMGNGVVEFSGTNTHTGNLTVDSTGGLVLHAAGQLLFDIEGNGTNNAISGSGTAVFDGTFFFDLATATIADGNMWTIASVTTQSFGGTFAVTSSLGDFTESAGVWTMVDGSGNTWTFTEATGVLSLAGLPEPFRDNDKDSIINRLEEAFGTDVNDPNSGPEGLPQVHTSNGTTQLLYRTLITEGTFVYEIRESVDGVNWNIVDGDGTPSDPQPAGLPAGYQQLEFELSYEPSKPVKLLRIEVLGD